MKTVVWQSLSDNQQESLLQRPAITEGANITAIVSDVIADVRQRGDDALLDLTEKFDKIRPEAIKVSTNEVDAAAARLSGEMKQALQQAYDNIATFHKAQKQKKHCGLKPSQA